MKRLIILGAGGFGREVAGYARLMQERGSGWDIAGFLDDNPDALKGYEDLDFGIIGSIQDYFPQEEDLFANGIGQPALRKQLVEKLESRGARFTTIIHPSVIIGRNVTFGDGCVFPPNVVLTADVRIGRHTCLNVGTCVSHDAVLGDFVQTSNFCDITGYVTLEDGVFMGSHATVLPSITVGKWAKIGAGAVVIKKVRPETTVIGLPARQLVKR